MYAPTASCYFCSSASGFRGDFDWQLNEHVTMKYEYNCSSNVSFRPFCLTFISFWPNTNFLCWQHLWTTYTFSLFSRSLIFKAEFYFLDWTRISAAREDPRLKKDQKRYKRQHKRLGLGIASLSTSFVFLLISNTKRVKNYFKLKGKHEILVKNKGAKNAILTSLSQRGYNS